MLSGLSLALVALGLLVNAPAAAAEPTAQTQFAVATAPDDGVRQRRLAQDLLERGDLAGAVGVLAATAEELPQDAAVWTDYALALADSGQFRRAAAAIDVSLALDSCAFTANKIAAFIFERLGRERETNDINRRLAALGDRIAMYDLAEAFLQGRGVAADAGTAVGWMERAAEAGHFGAMIRLAEIYRAGLHGQLPDAERSERWQMLADAD